MIPIKSPDQISYRIKRLSSIYGYPNNAMKVRSISHGCFLSIMQFQIYRY